MKKKSLYAILFIILAFHLLMTLIWGLLDKIQVVNKYTVINNKRHGYNYCSYPSSKKIR